MHEMSSLLFWLRAWDDSCLAAAIGSWIFFTRSCATPAAIVHADRLFFTVSAITPSPFLHNSRTPSKFRPYFIQNSSKLCRPLKCHMDLYLRLFWRTSENKLVMWHGQPFSSEPQKHCPNTSNILHLAIFLQSSFQTLWQLEYSQLSLWEIVKWICWYSPSCKAKAEPVQWTWKNRKILLIHALTFIWGSSSTVLLGCAASSMMCCQHRLLEPPIFCNFPGSIPAHVKLLMVWMPTKFPGTEEDKNSVHTYYIFQREKIRFILNSKCACWKKEEKKNSHIKRRKARRSCLPDGKFPMPFHAPQPTCIRAKINSSSHCSCNPNSQNPQPSSSTHLLMNEPTIATNMQFSV